MDTFPSIPLQIGSLVIDNQMARILAYFMIISNTNSIKQYEQ
jgi:hypothetical protein